MSACTTKPYVKLTNQDRDLIAQLKAERKKHLLIAKSLSDREIGLKFDVCENTVLRIPAWEEP